MTLQLADSIATRASRTWSGHGTEQVDPPRAQSGRRSLSDGHDLPLPRLATAPERVRDAGLQEEEAGI